MIELINFANYSTNLEMIGHNPRNFRELLNELGVHGVEALFCDPWNQDVIPADLIYGVHLNFWPTWLSFWQGDQQALERQFCGLRQIVECFGGAKPECMLEAYRTDIQQAKAANAKYIVFHVSHNECDELYTWQFRTDNKTVIDAAVEVVNCLVADIPSEMNILFENLWWPGLTLLEPRLAERLLSRVKHPRVGIMLDTGHLMNTSQELETEQQGIDYVLHTLNKLGYIKAAIKGIHLHQSLSGAYVKQSRTRIPPVIEPAAAMAHVMKIDQHRPFSDSAAKAILESVQPEFLVHEFIVSSREELLAHTAQQRQALR